MTGVDVLWAILFVGILLARVWESHQHRLEIQRYQAEHAKLTASFLAHSASPMAASTYQTYQPEPVPTTVVHEPEAIEKPIGL